MIRIDGSQGEGGGQILRSALALSMGTGQPFSINGIRAGRSRPGLLRQHLTAVRAATAISDAAVDGDELRSGQLVFSPETVRGGDYRFAVGTAGSCLLVLQTILLPLLRADEPSEIVLEGGTHNPHAPPYHYLEKVFVPLLRRMGAEVDLALERYGFYPAGGGRVVVRVRPGTRPQQLALVEGGGIVRRQATALVVKLAENIARRELKQVHRKLNWSEDELTVATDDRAVSPGNVVMLEVEREQVTELFTGFGARDVASEKVANQAIEEAKEYLAVGEAAVGKHLADQLLLPMAMGEGGAFTTLPLTRHTTTNIDIIRQFLAVKIETREIGRKVHEVRVG
jgi:RNA 3'-terminal phosphate cyclase (ATP)